MSAAPEYWTCASCTYPFESANGCHGKRVCGVDGCRCWCNLSDEDKAATMELTEELLAEIVAEERAGKARLP